MSSPQSLVLSRQGTATAIPLVCIERTAWPAFEKRCDKAARQWMNAQGFRAEPGSWCALPDAKGGIARVVAGVGAGDDPWLLAALPMTLPEGRYALAEDAPPVSPYHAALSWVLGSYRFTAYRAPKRAPAQLCLAPSAEALRGAEHARTVGMVRDWVTTPTEDMGPEHLADAAAAVAREGGAKLKVRVGEQLLRDRFPAIHTVGRASARPPRLIELNWGKPAHPLVAIAGKGVCFDTGGLNIKTGDYMRLMKKDMGGAANALGLARLIMQSGLPVRLQLLIPAVENAIDGNAYRPGDVIRTRKGVTVEVGNTDAEGRIVLADALAYACEGKPDLLLDFATLTGAARVALGPELPAMFSNDEQWAAQFIDAAAREQDPLWRMPLWSPYEKMIESDCADINNAGGSYAGAITAALFLQHFVEPGTRWCHVDLFAWISSAKPGRPVGGEAQTIRAALAALQARYAKKR